MKIDLTKYTIDELVKLRDQINGLIYNHSDGYLYICSVRQFGSVWEEKPSSLQSLKELCERNVSETARRLNMHRRTLQRILSKRSPK